MATILIADDERMTRNSYKTLFEAEGFSVRLAKDGAEAVRLFLEGRPDLVLLDVMMPKMNGLAACAEIRKSDALVPILFFTALPSDVSLVRGLGLGGDDYIDKARSPEELVARVRAALRKREAFESHKAGDDRIELGRVTVDLRGMFVVEAGGTPVDLTRYEALLIRALNDARGTFVDNDTLASCLHGDDCTGDPTRIRKSISVLKKKLGVAGDMIANSRTNGNMLLP